MPLKSGDVGEGGERVGAGTTAGTGTVAGAAAEGNGRSGYQLGDSGLFQGFIPASADKIFESTYEKKT